ncbi:MAG: OsmC family protein [Candidatus Limnocylindrales bacterium]
MRETGHLRWAGGLAFSGVSGSEGTIAWEGTDGLPGLRPSEAVLASLGACTAMDVIAILAKKRQVVERYEVTLEAELADAHPKVFRRIEVVHEVEGPEVSVEAVRRSIELSATRYCIVNATLSSGAVEIHHRYLVRNLEGEHQAEVVVTGPLGRGVQYGDAEAPATPPAQA